MKRMTHDARTTSAVTDRLSRLPDDILIIILSLLDDPRQVVRTSELSKRWLNLWTFVPRLELQYAGFVKGLGRFLNFGSEFLRLRDNATDLHFFKLHMRINNYLDAHDSTTLKIKMFSWISYALTHNPRNLYIGCKNIIDGFEFNLNLPNCLFTCKSLEDIYLGPLSGLGLPDVVFLPNLKRVHLAGVEISGFDKLIFGCPGIETLTLSKGRFGMKKDISFPNLQKLSIYYCEFYTQGGDHPRCYISAPCLEYLKFIGSRHYAIKFKHISKVRKAKILFITDPDLEFLSSLSHVENLNLYSCINIKHLLEVELPKRPVFHKLKKLNLGPCCVGCHFGMLCIFLKQCPNLEILEIDFNDRACVGLCERVENSEEFERFSCKQLRLVNFVTSSTWDFTGMDRIQHHFCKMRTQNLQINYILWNGEVLKTVNIGPDGVI